MPRSVNLLRTLRVIKRHKALFDRDCPETVTGKNRVPIPQTPEKNVIDSMTRILSGRVQGQAASGKRTIGKCLS